MPLVSAAVARHEEVVLCVVPRVLVAHGEKNFEPPRNKTEERPGHCELCGAEFIRKPRTKRFCSERCQRLAERRRYRARHTEGATCKGCGAMFERSATPSACSSTAPRPAATRSAAASTRPAPTFRLGSRRLERRSDERGGQTTNSVWSHSLGGTRCRPKRTGVSRSEGYERRWAGKDSNLRLRE